MSDSESFRSSATGSIRRVLDSLLAVVENRLHLFAIEFKIEKCRVVELLVLAVCALFFGILAGILLAVTLVLLVAVEYRIYVIAGLCLVCAIAAIASLRRLRARLKEPPPFRESVAQLKKDREWFTTRK